MCIRDRVRIVGQHEQEESDVNAEELPWAQVMYPVTAGGGQGGSYMTPALKQGMFVFGFFLDGKDQQTPIIMGVLGNNAKTKLERKMGTEGSGGQNFVPQSFYSIQQKLEDVADKILKDTSLAPKQAGNEAYSSPSKENVTVESSDANNLKTTGDEKKDQILEEKHALACPDPDNQSEVKNMQTVIEKISAKIEKFQQSLLDADLAAGLPILENNKDIDQVIEEGAEEMAKYMKGIMGKVQQFTTKEFNDKLLPLENVTPPSHTLDVLDKKVKGLEKIACMFNGLAGVALVGLLAAALKNAFNRKKKKAENAAANAATSEAGVAGVSTSAVIPSVPTLDTPGAGDVAPPSADGFYRPTPLCETEEIIGEVLGGTINTIMSGFDSAIGPVVDEIQNSLGGTATETGSENIGTIDNAINENNVLASLSSGALVLSITQTVASEAKIDPNTVGGANRYWSDGTWGSGLLSLIDSAGQNTPDNQQLIADALSLIDDKSNPTGIAAGMVLASNLLGVNENLLTGIGNAFQAIRTGDIPNLLNAAGSLASIHPRVLNAIAGRGASLAGMRPIVVHPRMDFMMYAMDPIINQAAKWSYMFGGQSSPSITIRGIINRGGEQGAQHSQALHSWFAHIPGLKVVLPSSVADARDLLIASVLAEQPVIYIDDRWLYDQEDVLPEAKAINLESISPNILREGDSITLVGCSYSTFLLKKITKNLIKNKINPEIIDMRIINPFYSELITNSVKP